MVWNTTYHIVYDGDGQLGDSVMTVLNDVGKSLNVFDPNSLVSRVNISDSSNVDAHFEKVYTISQKIHNTSGGMFDPTVSPLVTAWGFGPGHTLSADTLAVDSILSFVGFGKTHLKHHVVTKEDIRTQFNFSAVAKGYGCDKVAEMLLRNGVKNYLVEIGGEIALGGTSPKGGKWTISIDRPVESDSIIHDSFIIISLTDCGIATSGNYRNFRKEEGKTFGHTISPVTGRPVSTDVVSATVIAPTSMEADAAATACMAAGSKKAIEMLQELGYDALLILSDNTTVHTSGFNKFTN